MAEKWQLRESDIEEVMDLVADEGITDLSELFLRNESNPNIARPKYYPFFVERNTGGHVQGFARAELFGDHEDRASRYTSVTTVRLTHLAAFPYATRDRSLGRLLKLVEYWLIEKRTYGQIIAEVPVDLHDLFTARGWEAAPTGGGWAWIEESTYGERNDTETGRRRNQSTAQCFSVFPESVTSTLFRRPGSAGAVIPVPLQPGQLPTQEVQKALDLTDAPGWAANWDAIAAE